MWRCTYWHIVPEEAKVLIRVSNPKPKPNTVKNKMSVEMAQCNLYPCVICTPGFTVALSSCCLEMETLVL
jgi:hypothetical protein